MNALRFHPAAIAELEEAVRWVEAERPGYGALLFDEIQRRVAQASRFPQSGAPVNGTSTRHVVRAFTARVFRYRVITATIDNEHLVIAIAHENRDPIYWRDRLR